MLSLMLILGACSKEVPDQSLTPGTFAGEGRDRLCIAGGPNNYRAGLIAYGTGDTNCTASGRIDTEGGQIALVPSGDTTCRVPLTIEGNTVRVGDVAATCSYYCGPGASMAGKTFNRSDMGAKAVDLVGDPLC